MAKAGRPRKIKSIRQFEERTEAYFRECEAKGESALLTGPTLALGLCSQEGSTNLLSRGPRRKGKGQAPIRRLRLCFGYTAWAFLRLMEPDGTDVAGENG